MIQKHFFTSRLGTLLLGSLGLSPNALDAQHIHINAGAISTTQDAPLYFANGNLFDTNASYDVYLALTNAGPFANLYQGAGATFTSLASTLDNGGPAFGHAADGAFLQLQLVSISGPSGGVFSVWTQDAGNPSVSHPLFTLPVETDNGTNLLVLSQNDGSFGSDPYGHIHGRSFTATKPGLYTLGCRIIDTSSNGTGGGPIHRPSSISYFYFQAGLTLSIENTNPNATDISFGTTAGKSYYVESTPELASPNWTPFAGPFSGNNHLQYVTTNSSAPQLFFRLRTN